MSDALSSRRGLDKRVLRVQVNKGSKGLAPSAPKPKQSLASEPRLGVTDLAEVSLRTSAAPPWLPKAGCGAHNSL